MSTASQKIAGVFVTAFFVALTVFCLCLYFQHYRNIDIAKFYSQNMRASLFAGFLTLGSFLLSLKTGIVIKIKENVYDSSEYLETIDDAIKSGLNVKVYAPLKRLSLVLSAAVGAALLASVSQLTLGLIPCWWMSSVCLSLAAFALVLLFFAFILIQLNLRTWFSFLEKKAEKAKKVRDEAKKKGMGT